jgi:hypothetical protein
VCCQLQFQRQKCTDVALRSEGERYFGYAFSSNFRLTNLLKISEVCPVFSESIFVEDAIKRLHRSQPITYTREL